MAKLDLASSEWCQLIFEGKNQAYGAYRMRANSPRRHTIAMLIVVAIAIVGFTIPTLLKLATPEQKEVMTEVTTLSKLAEPEIKQEEMKRNFIFFTILNCFFINHLRISFYLINTRNNVNL